MATSRSIIWLSRTHRSYPVIHLKERRSFVKCGETRKSVSLLLKHICTNKSIVQSAAVRYAAKSRTAGM